MAVPVEASAPFASSPVQTEDQFWRMSRVFGGLDAIDPEVLGPDSGLVTADGSGMHVFVEPFYAHVGGAWAYQPTRLTVPVDAADSGRRHDRVVVRREPANDRCVVDVLKGTPGGGHPAPTLDQAGVWELPLGLATVAANATNMPSGSTHDERRLFTGDGRIRCASDFPMQPRDGQEILAQNSWVWRWQAAAGVWEQVEPGVLLDIGDNREGTDHVRSTGLTADWRRHAVDGIARLSGQFVCPSHGHVTIMVRSSIQCHNNGGRGYVSARVYGPGIGTYAPGPFSWGAARSNSADTDVMCWLHLSSGLVPLATYGVEFVFQSQRAKVQYGNRRLQVRRG